MKNKKGYKRIKAVKKDMSQFFDDNAKVIPFTGLELDKSDLDYFENMEINQKLKITGLSKGRGFAGSVKRWGFRAGPKTHGQIRRRSPGSIGAQGVGRVLPGKKMPGRYGGEKITFDTKFLGLDKDSHIIKVKGGVPGGRNSKVMLYITVGSEGKNIKDNEN